MNRLSAILAVGLVVHAPFGFAREVAGVKLPDTAQVGDAALVLNGAGVRSKFFVKVYVGALYLPAVEREAARIVAADSPFAVHLHFLHSEVEAKKLVDAWNDGFTDNHDAARLAALKARIERFNGLFRTVRRGDVVRVEYLPGRGTTVTISNEERGVIEGADFRAALLRIWLGDHPADASLKEAMLGG
jgi:hypothetical protein